MSYRTVIVDVVVRVRMKIDEGESPSEILQEMDYHMTDTTGKANIEDTEVMTYSVIDSK